MKFAEPRPIKDYCVGIYDGPHATPKEAGDGPVFLGIKNITDDGALDLSEIRHVSEEEYPRWTRRVTPQAGDVVFTYEATLHRYALIPEGFRGCLGRRVALVRPDPDRVDSQYLLYFFLSRAWRQVVESNVITGATVDRVPLERFPDFPAALPGLRVQQQIAHFLSAYDTLIENNRRRMALLEEAARQLYREWFVRLRFPGHEHTRIMKGVPEGWERRTFAEACSSLEDGDWIETKDQGGDDYRLLQISNIGINEFVETGNYRYVTEQTFKRLNCRELLPGHILIARMPTPIGRAWLITAMPWRMVTAVDAAIAVANEELADALFLTHYLNSPASLEHCERRAVGATRPRIARRELAALPLLLPPRRLQAHFREFAEPLNQQRAVLYRQNEKLRAARDLLLPRLMSGEIAA
jgi:type I restriction enzyme S subunit